jgi:hypothetical protein
MMTTTQAENSVILELERAYAKHGLGQWGRHEFYAILKEEVDELWDDIKADAPQANIEKEAIQIAAMVFRYLETGDRYKEPANEKYIEPIEFYRIKQGLEEIKLLIEIAEKCNGIKCNGIK